MSTTSVAYKLRQPLAVRGGVVVDVELCTPAVDGDGFVVDGVASVRTAPNGACTLKLTPNVEISPAGTWYQVTPTDGATRTISVPVSSSTVAFKDCLVDNPQAPGQIQVGVSADAFAQGLAPKSNATDAVALTRIERQARQMLDSYNRRALARFSDATVTTELWANIAAWAGVGSVAGGVMFGSAAGLAKATGLTTPGAGRRLYRSQLHIPAGGSSGYGFFGVSSDAAGSAPSGSTSNVFLLGINSGVLAPLQGANVSGSVSNPFSLLVPVGDYDATIAIDETTVSLSLHTANPGQAVYSVSVQRSQLPGGAVNNIVFSCSDGAGGISWGPVVQVNDLTLPPRSAYSPNGVTLFGAGHPLIFNRRSTASSIRQLIYVPGGYDPRVPAPVVLYMHEALAGHAGIPYTDAKWANVLAAFDTAGYILVSSDNGTNPAGAGTGTPTAGQVATWDDQYGNQRGLTDYAIAVNHARRTFNTGALCLLGLSQGGEFVQNVLADRTGSGLGNVAAAASISPSTDLVAVSQLTDYSAAIKAVWGATDAPSFAAAIAGFNPVKQTAAKLRGVPQRFYVALDDAITPKATHVDPVVAAITGYAPEQNVVTVANGGHLAAALYQGADLVSFFGTYAGAPT